MSKSVKMRNFSKLFIILFGLSTIQPSYAASAIPVMTVPKNPATVIGGSIIVIYATSIYAIFMAWKEYYNRPVLNDNAAILSHEQDFQNMIALLKKQNLPELAQAGFDLPQNAATGLIKAIADEKKNVKWIRFLKRRGMSQEIITEALFNYIWYLSTLPRYQSLSRTNFANTINANVLSICSNLTSTGYVNECLGIATSAPVEQYREHIFDLMQKISTIVKTDVVTNETVSAGNKTPTEQCTLEQTAKSAQKLAHDLLTKDLTGIPEDLISALRNLELILSGLISNTYPANTTTVGGLDTANITAQSLLFVTGVNSNALLDPMQLQQIADTIKKYNPDNIEITDLANTLETLSDQPDTTDTKLRNIAIFAASIVVLGTPLLVWFINKQQLSLSDTAGAEAFQRNPTYMVKYGQLYSYETSMRLFGRTRGGLLQL